MDTWDDGDPRPRTVETVENGGLDEFADEGEEPGAPPVPPVAATATSEQTAEAARESVEPPIASAADVAAPPVWCDALSPAEMRTLRGLVAFVAVLVYAGLVIGIWNRAVASDRRRALASAEIAPAHPSTLPPVAAPIVPSPIPSARTPSAPSAPIAAPLVAPPAPPVARRARRPVPSPRPRTPSAPRAPAASLASPSGKPSLAVGGSRSESERDRPDAAVAAVPALPADAVASEAHLAAEPPAAVVTAVDPLAADRSAVTAVLAAYRKSYNALDARSAAAIWEGVDERALRRAFSSLRHQNVSFERCDVRLPAGDRAVARCDGVLSYVAKFGDSGSQQRRTTWDMDLRRNGGRWMIVSVNTR